MLNKIKNRIDKELRAFIIRANDVYSLKKTSPLLSDSIKDFVLRKGKRVRPTLFIIGYLGFAKKSVPGLYTASLSLELLHDFMLVHDDIIDKSDTRRGKPSMHKMLNNHLKNCKGLKFNGQDLSIVVGDIMYAMSIGAFLAVKEDRKLKEAALKKLVEAAIYTGSGELLELLNGIKDIENITKQNIYKVYDLKTAYYTFAFPLVIGATLAAANKTQIDKLLKYGLCLGRAFQIKDDLLGIFSEEKETGKSSIADLQEAKRTILIWHAYNHCDKKDKIFIKKVFHKKSVTKQDLMKMRKIIISSGALNYARNEIQKLAKEASSLIASSKMRKKYKDCLNTYTAKVLNMQERNHGQVPVEYSFFKSLQ